MNDRKPADKGTDDAPGTPEVSGTSPDAVQPSNGVAAGASGDEEPGAGRGTADAPAAASDADAGVPDAEPSAGDAAQIPETGRAAGGEPETVTSAQIPETAKTGHAPGAAGNAKPESALPSAADDSWHDTPIAESVRRATERAEQVQADAATAGERGAAGLPGPVSRPGRTLLETLRDKPILAAIPASVLAFIFWRAFRGR
ncbi:hypothetical protein IU479_14275 [Nocardia abscessus]|uniref:hypothetical protein n=1 Tax=Nocardia TaxID=1817 RepID=UPI0018938079|nr:MULTISPECIES: hypothetical protein [Nocardia]MBF6219277.1 hypothetical protein [Nocardia abscessus]MDE1669172.1 hypothetical protein [Nocardia gipuzkoensis]